MSDLYAVRVAARPDDRTIDLDIKVVHPDSMHIPVSPGFALMLLHDTADGDVPLSRELDLQTLMNGEWARAHARAFVDSVELLSSANEPPAEALHDSTHAYWKRPGSWLEARLRIRVTHPAWLAHVRKRWDSASFDPASDYEPSEPASPDDEVELVLEGDVEHSDGFLVVPKLMIADDVAAACPELIWLPRHGARAYRASEHLPVSHTNWHAWLGKPVLWSDGSDVHVGIVAQVDADQLALMSIHGGGRTTHYREPESLAWIGPAAFARGTPRLPPAQTLEQLLRHASPAVTCVAVEGRTATLTLYVLARDVDEPPRLDTSADVLRLIAIPAGSVFGDFDAAGSKLGCALRRDMETHELGWDGDLYPVVANAYVESFMVNSPASPSRAIDLDELDAAARVQFISERRWPAWTVEVTVGDEAWLEHLREAKPWTVDDQELEPPEDWDDEPRSYDPELDVPQQEEFDDDDESDESAPKSTLRRRFELSEGARKGGESLPADDPRAVLRDHGLCEDLSHPRAREDFETACKTGNVEAVRAYARHGIDLNSHAEISGETPLIRAAEGDHPAVIRALAEAGVDLEGRDGGGDTAVMTAVNWKHPEALRTLLEVGASPDAPDNWDNFPLVKALDEDEGELIEILLDGGASPNAGAATRDSALHWCLRNSNGEWLSQLIDRGGDPNLTTAHAVTLLHLATAESETGLAEQLLDAGADPARSNAWGWNPRDVAEAVGADDLAALLEERGAPLTQGDAIEYLRAIAEAQPDAVTSLLDGGLDIETRDHLGRTGFLIAVEEQPEIARLLVERGADIHALDANGDNALSRASDRDQVLWLLDIGVAASLRDQKGALRHPGIEAVLESDDPELLDKLLDPRTNLPDLSDLSACHSSLIWGDFEGRLEQRAETLRRLGAAGADLHAVERRDGSPLIHGYISRGHEPCVMALLEVGVDIECEDKNFSTALIKSCSEYSHHEEQARITEALLERGADYVKTEWLGRSAWDTADSVSNRGCLDALERRFEQTLIDALAVCGLPATVEPDSDDELLFAALAQRTNAETFMHWVRRGRHEIVRGLLRAGYDPNPPTHDCHGLRPGKLPLTCAISAGDEAMVDILLSGGANPDLVQMYGSTALSYAVGEQRVDMVQRLLAAGAKPDPFDDWGHTPLSGAAARGNLEMMELLVEAGASVQPSPAGRLPLHAAVKGGHFEAAQWLLQRGADIDARSDGRITALHVAIDEDEVELALALLAAGADPNVQASDDERNTPLICATKKGQVEVIEALLAAGADPHVQDAGGQSAIDHAAYREELRVLFPEAGAAPVFMPLTRELQPLLRAVHTGDADAFAAALAEAEDVDVTNYRGDTALMLAAGYRRKAMAEQLLERGANLHATNAKGDGAWTYAFVNGADQLREMFEARGFVTSMDALNQMAAQSLRRDAARDAINAGDIARVAKLIDELEFDVDFLGLQQRPLELALARGDAALIQLLLAKGADASLPDAYGVPLAERGREAGFEEVFE